MQIEEVVDNYFRKNPHYALFKDRARQGKLVRDENPTSHFCSYMGIFDKSTKKIFMGHHKKADKWIFNGGHIDAGETPLQAAIRELQEEVGLRLAEKDLIGPSLINLIHIPASPKFPCRVHYHIWYFVPVGERYVDIRYPELAKEFYENKWLSINDALAITTDETNTEALKFLQDRIL